MSATILAAAVADCQYEALTVKAWSRPACRALGLAIALAAVCSTRSIAQQQFLWDDYCTVGGLQFCASVELGLVPGGPTAEWGSVPTTTTLSIRIRNLEGTLGTNPWAMSQVEFNNLQTDAPLGGFATPTRQATLSGSAQFLLTASPAECALMLVPSCPGPGWGNAEWDWWANGFYGSGVTSGTYWGTDYAPFDPVAVVGCDAPPQGPYWATGYYQTCGDGWVGFEFTLPGTWTFDQSSYVSLVGWGQDDSLFTCQFGQGCAAATPEPMTVVLLATGLLGIGVVRRRRKHAPDG